MNIQDCEYKNINNEIENNLFYISDIIKKEDINTWNKEEIVFIEAPTGRGKSHFIKHTLSEYDSNKKILLLVNRTIIKNQSEKELLKDETLNENITITTYQNIANKILDHKVYKFEGYDYIICDESHHFCEESVFCHENDLAFDWVMNQNSIKIFMTATAYFIKNYLEKELKLKIKHYHIQNTYNFIKQLYFYEDDDVIKKLLLELPSDEKAIYFTSAKKAHETSEILDSCAFYCSKNNFAFNSYVNPETIQYIEENEKFEEHILCTTQVMDCGVNIKDKAVMHIIIDIADLSSIIQCIGRKRIQDNEKIIVYIKNKKGNAIVRKLEQTDEKLRYANILKQDGVLKLVAENAHKNTYGHLIYDIINYSTNQIDKKVNELMYYTYNKNKETYEEILSNKETGFIIKLFERMGVELEYKSLEDEYDAMELSDILNKFVGIKMFDEDQEKFKKIINENMIKVIKGNHNSLGYRTINSRFEELELNYIIVSKEEKSRKSAYMGKRYWMLGKKTFE